MRHDSERAGGTSVLDLSGRNLTEVPEWVRELRSLTGLDLSGNHLTELPGWLAEMPALTTLDVRDNPIVDADRQA